MRVVIPYSHDKYLDEVRAALSLDHPHSEDIYDFIDVSYDDEAYFHLFEGLWRAQQDFCIIEQDIIIDPQTLLMFRVCGNSWCASPYRYLNMMYAGLGCMRFRKELMVAVPGLPDLIAARSNPPMHPPRHWCTIDAYMQSSLFARGFGICRHAEVTHLGENWPVHGCHGPPPT